MPKRILNLRPVSSANSKLIEQLSELDVTLINCPSVVLTKRACLIDKQDCDKINLAIFISQASVQFGASFFQDKINDSSFICAAIGDKTALSLEALGFNNIISGEESNSESLLHAIEQLQPQKNIALVKGHKGRKFLEEHLLKSGTNLTILEVYQRECPPNLQVELKQLKDSFPIDLILATSIEVSQNFINHCPNECLEPLKHKTWIAMSTRIKNHLKTQGISKIVVTQHDLFSTIEEVIS